MPSAYSKWFRIDGARVRLELAGRFDGDEAYLNRAADFLIKESCEGASYRFEGDEAYAYVPPELR